MVANARHIVHTAVARTDVFAVNDVVQTEAHFVIGKGKTASGSAMPERIRTSFGKTVTGIRYRSIVKVPRNKQIFTIGKCGIHAERIYLLGAFSESDSKLLPHLIA